MGCGHRVDSLSKRTLVGRFKNHAVMTASVGINGSSRFVVNVLR